MTITPEIRQAIDRSGDEPLRLEGAVNCGRSLRHLRHCVIPIEIGKSVGKRLRGWNSRGPMVKLIWCESSARGLRRSAVSSRRAG